MVTDAPQKPPVEAPPSNFFAKLFDLSFESFITTSIIKGVYVLALLLSGVLALTILATFIAQGGTSILLGLVIAPLFFLAYAVFARIWLELIIVAFKIAEDVDTIARNSRQ